MEKPEPKNIVICSDGTGNSAMKGRGTNVFKLYEAIATASDAADPSHPEQIAFYDDGVGTERGRIPRIIGGAFGYGLSRNVRQLYAHICRVYEPNDKIFMLGFSRGAFTVRTLVGFLSRQGLPKPDEWSDDDELRRLVKRRYSEYRSAYKTAVQSGLANLFNVEQPTSSPTKVPIHFVGVWDTVDAVGFPIPLLATLWNTLLYRYKFPDNVLNADVALACQALALDDERWTFQPELWNYSPQDRNRIRQVWFAGMHSDVGGGYVRPGLSLCALKWILDNAAEQGLLFGESRLKTLIEGANPSGKMHNSRSGFGAYYRYRPRSVSRLHSLSFGNGSGFSDFLGWFPKGLSRSRTEASGNAFHLARDALHYGQEVKEELLSNLPRVHVSALRRIANHVDGYAPGNFPAHCNIEGLDRTTNEEFRVALSKFHRNFDFNDGERPAELADKEFPKGETFMVSMLDFSALRIFARQASQHIFLGLLLITVAASIPAVLDQKDIPPADWMMATPQPIKDAWRLVTTDWLNQVLLRIYSAHPHLVLWSIISGLLAYLVGFTARKSLERSYSRFWVQFFSEHPELRSKICK